MGKIRQTSTEGGWPWKNHRFKNLICNPWYPFDLVTKSTQKIIIKLKEPQNWIQPSEEQKISSSTKNLIIKFLVLIFLWLSLLKTPWSHPDDGIPDLIWGGKLFPVNNGELTGPNVQSSFRSWSICVCVCVWLFDQTEKTVSCQQSFQVLVKGGR